MANLFNEVGKKEEDNKEPVGALEEAGEEKESEPEEKPEPPKVTKDEETGEVGVTLPERPSRRERRAERWRKISELEAENAQLRRQAYQPPPQLQQPAPVAPVEVSKDKIVREKLAPIWRQQEMIQRLLAQKTEPDSESEKLKEQWYDLEAQKTLIAAEATKVAPAAPSAPQISASEQLLRGEFPDTFNHPQAMMYAMGLYHQKRAVLWAQGKQPTMATERECMVEASKQFGLLREPLPAASPTQQARHGAVTAQAGGRVGSKEIRLSKEHQRIAKARFSKLSDEDAYAKFAVLLRQDEANNR